MSSSVVVVGSFNVDHVWRCESLPAPGATIAGRYSTGPGGKEGGVTTTGGEGVGAREGREDEEEGPGKFGHSSMIFFQL